MEKKTSTPVRRNKIQVTAIRMRYLIIALTLAAIYLTASHFLFDTSGIYAPTLKIIFKSYQTITDYTDTTVDPIDANDDYVTSAVSIPQNVCNTWAMVDELLATVMADVNRSTKDIIQYGKTLLTARETFVRDTQRQVHHYQDRLQAARKEVKNSPGATSTILQQIYIQLDRMYEDILNITKNTFLDVGSYNIEAASVFKTLTFNIEARFHRSSDEFLNADPNVMECVCDAVVQTDHLYNRQYPNLQQCLEKFDSTTRDTFNMTRINFNLMTELTLDDVISSVETASVAHIIMDLPLKVRITNYLS